MLEITSLKNGIVIDHVKAGNGIKIFELLGLADIDDQVALILNAESSNMGRKDIIKVENHQNIDLDVVSIIDPQATVNIIENEEVVEKKELELPDKIINVLTCQNPKCISTSERSVPSKFILFKPEEKQYKCAYCDHIYGVEE
ncbi:aspartate carbamoyltransferase regulatory subunit [Anaerococcus cruorum]|mgnify:FL=1|uniref:aspartate carbamoyltransferase regulatory subunit n=1 Tax=Anaerococcus sp. WGS1596 TaxID=3366806 RepID=UPI00372D6EF0